MAALHRFFVPAWNGPGRLKLSGPEARHLAVVLRAQPGDGVILFDGRGGEADATIRNVENREIELEVTTCRHVAAPSIQVTLAVAVPKGDRFTWLVEKLTEMGVDRLIPLSTQYSVVEPGAGKLGRMRRTIVEASKQSRRTRLMELAELTSLEQLLADCSAAGPALWVADPKGLSWQEIAPPPPANVVVIIGPEGGLSPTELNLLERAGARRLRLGGQILRIETAAIVAGALFCCSSPARPTES